MSIRIEFHWKLFVMKMKPSWPSKDLVPGGTTHERIGDLTSASLPSVTLPNQELLAPNFQISHCYLTEIMSTSAVVPTIFTTHQVSSSFRRNAAIDKNNLSVIISYICQWENISGMRAWMAYQCFVMLFNGSINCCWWPGAIWQQELLLLWHPVYHYMVNTGASNGLLHVEHQAIIWINVVS